MAWCVKTHPTKLTPARLHAGLALQGFLIVFSSFVEAVASQIFGGTAVGLRDRRGCSLARSVRRWIGDPTAGPGLKS